STCASSGRPVCELLGRCLTYSARSFFFIAPPPSELSTLSLHDALPIWSRPHPRSGASRRHRPHAGARRPRTGGPAAQRSGQDRRSEEHTSELQSRRDLVCRLLLEKKKKNEISPYKVGGHEHTEQTHRHL